MIRLIFIGLFICQIFPTQTVFAKDSNSVLREKAEVLWEQGSVMHAMGLFDYAIAFFKHSIDVQPSAEAHTYLGWSLSHQGKLKEAIAHCKKAIPLDPTFGNPYNDIGVYLLEAGKPKAAIPWLRKAMHAKRYCCYQFPHYNLARILQMKGDLEGAEREFKKALEFDPDYEPARLGLEVLKRFAPKL